ncbi:MAG: hypothetical protein EOO72_02075, partial [Myxococcaceae bacterium]
MLCFTGAVLLSLSCGPQGEGEGAVEADGTYATAEAALTAPTLLEAVPGDGQVALRWSAGPAGTQGYQVRYRVAGGSWAY